MWLNVSRFVDNFRHRSGNVHGNQRVKSKLHLSFMDGAARIAALTAAPADGNAALRLKNIQIL